MPSPDRGRLIGSPGTHRGGEQYVGPLVSGRQYLGSAHERNLAPLLETLFEFSS
jgi:hypothetical protein